MKKWGKLAIMSLTILMLTACGSEQKAKKVSTESSIKTEESSSETLDSEFNIGDTVNIKDYEIKVNEVTYSDGSEYIKPDEGKEFVIINITINNKTSEKQTYNPFDYSLNADGNSQTVGMAYLPDVDTLNSGTLDPEATVTGNIIGVANKDVKKLKLEYKSNILKSETVDIILK